MGRIGNLPLTQQATQFVHDSEYCILAAQHGEAWTVEDTELKQRLAELRQRFGALPNIIHIMTESGERVCLSASWGA